MQQMRHSGAETPRRRRSGGRRRPSGRRASVWQTQSVDDPSGRGPILCDWGGSGILCSYSFLVSKNMPEFSTLNHNVAYIVLFTFPFVTLIKYQHHKHE